VYARERICVLIDGSVIHHTIGDDEGSVAMVYSTEIYELADKELENIRAKNLGLYKEKLAKLYEKHPELQEIDDKILDLRKKAIASNFKSAKIEKEIFELSAQREKVTNDNDYKPQFNCKKCKDTGVLGFKMCDCKKELALKIASKKADSNSNFWHSFDDFNLNLYPDDVGKRGMTKRRIAEFVLGAAKNFDLGNALILGPVGVGKTFLSECIANKWQKMGKTVCYYSATRLFLMLNDQYFNKEKSHELSDKVNLLYEADLLIIDDLGVEFRNSFTETMFFDILNSRLMAQKSMVISTNLSLGDISHIYSDRIYSRIRGHFNVWELLGDDIREVILKKESL